jgi:hypothetical protein
MYDRLPTLTILLLIEAIRIFETSTSEHLDIEMRRVKGTLRGLDPTLLRVKGHRDLTDPTLTQAGSDPGTLQGRAIRVSGSRAGSRGTLTTIYSKIKAEIDAYRDACRDKQEFTIRTPLLSLNGEGLRPILLRILHSNPGQRGKLTVANLNTKLPITMRRPLTPVRIRYCGGLPRTNTIYYPYTPMLTALAHSPLVVIRKAPRTSDALQFRTCGKNDLSKICK